MTVLVGKWLGAVTNFWPVETIPYHTYDRAGYECSVVWGATADTSTALQRTPPISSPWQSLRNKSSQLPARLLLESTPPSNRTTPLRRP